MITLLKVKEVFFMIKFVFQGDSITDADRRRENDNNYGYGYPNLVASYYLKNMPGEIELINRGVSGDRIVDLYARIKMDIINLKPDYMSILIGVNDVWHELNEQNGVATEKYERIYSMLIEEVRAELPNIKIVILEPFVLKGPATTEKWEVFSAGVKDKALAAKRVAEKFGLTFVELQNKFDDAAKKAETTHWLSDGVHPTAAGHEIIKEALIGALDL